jgi:nucleotide-binding universal stress UspA family protein
MSAPVRLLVPTDFSAIAEEALDYAFALAVQLRAKVDILHVYFLPIFPEGVSVSRDLLGQIGGDAGELLKRMAEPRQDSPALGRLLLEHGDPREVIVQTAEKQRSDLIVMGTHGRRGFQRVLLGSVTEEVMRRAHCPVLTVRAYGADAEV